MNKALTISLSLALTTTILVAAPEPRVGSSSGVTATNSPSGNNNYLRNDGTNYYYGAATAEATNAINNSVGRGTNTTISGLTNIAQVINQSWVHNTGDQTNTSAGTVKFQGGTLLSAGSTNTAHQRNTGWVENSAGVTNTAAGTVQNQGGVTHSGGETNTSHARNTGWVENSGNVTNTSAGTVKFQGGTLLSAGSTNSAHQRNTGWVENSAGTTNIGNVATHQGAPLLVLGGLIFPPTTNTALTVNVVTNVVQRYVTNDSFTVTFTGTAPDGARGEFQVWNTAATDKTLTWPVSWSEQTGAGITSITLISNSITRILWRIESGSNYVSVSQKDPYQLAFGANAAVGQPLEIMSLFGGAGGSMIITNGTDDTGAGGTEVRFQTNTVTVGSQTNLNIISTNHSELGILATNNTTTGSADYHVYVGSDITRDAEFRSEMAGSNYVNRTELNGSNYTSRAEIAGSNYVNRTELAGSNYTSRAEIAGSNYVNRAELAGSNYTSRAEIAGSNFVDVASNQLITGVKGIGTLNVATNLTVDKATVTNNITFLSADIFPTGNATNFQADYTFAWRTILMTNAVRFTGVVNTAAANLSKAYIAKLRNTSGGALRLSVDTGFRRSGTNDVSVGNNQNADVLITPDGTGEANPTNHTAQIILYDSP